MRWPVALACVLTLAVSACESDRARGGGSPTSKRDGGGVVSDATSSSDGFVGVDGASDGGAGADASITDVGSSARGPELVYDGPLDGGLVTDRVVVWSWTSDAPVLAADAMLGTARITPWDTSAPPPLVIFVRQDNNALWYTQLAQVDADGVIGGVVADRARAWSFPAP